MSLIQTDARPYCGKNFLFFFHYLITFGHLKRLYPNLDVELLFPIQKKQSFKFFAYGNRLSYSINKKVSSDFYYPFTVMPYICQCIQLISRH